MLNFDRSTVKHGTQNIQNDCHQRLSDSIRVHTIRFLLRIFPPNIALHAITEAQQCSLLSCESGHKKKRFVAHGCYTVPPRKSLSAVCEKTFVVSSSFRFSDAATIHRYSRGTFTLSSKHIFHTKKQRF